MPGGHSPNGFAIDNLTVGSLGGELPPPVMIPQGGQLIPAAVGDHIQMIVVESGADHLNRWRPVRRNIAEDYRRAFGNEPPRITGVAIMTDSDNTGESATAWYGDIVFHRLP